MLAQVAYEHDGRVSGKGGAIEVEDRQTYDALFGCVHSRQVAFSDESLVRYTYDTFRQVARAYHDIIG